MFLSHEDNELVLLRVAHHSSGMVARSTRPASAAVPVLVFETAKDVEYANHPDYDSQEWESMLTALKDELQADTMRLREAGYAVNTAICFGEPGRSIVEHVEDEDINLVAMATYVRSGLSRLISGSVAEYVVHNVSVPILLLHAVETEAEHKTTMDKPSEIVVAGHALK